MYLLQECSILIVNYDSDASIYIIISNPNNFVKNVILYKVYVEKKTNKYLVAQFA